jgi:uncharacterized membrane protein YtjA (UPF0391 family)
MRISDFGILPGDGCQALDQAVAPYTRTLLIESPRLSLRASEKGTPMLRYAVIFFIIALVAALFGFGGIAGTAAGIAKILFYIFIALLVVSLMMGMAGGRELTS